MTHFERDRTGQGQIIQANMVDGSASANDNLLEWAAPL
jgi:crotonobetainyl-CoA:carnitine CoA-transferase CaiB-like acyl-CoA transferase